MPNKEILITEEQKQEALLRGEQRSQEEANMELDKEVYDKEADTVEKHKELSKGESGKEADTAEGGKHPDKELDKGEPAKGTDTTESNNQFGKALGEEEKQDKAPKHGGKHPQGMGKYLIVAVGLIIVVLVGFNLFQSVQIKGEMNRLLAEYNGENGIVTAAGDGLTLSGSLTPVNTYSVTALTNGKILSVFVEKGALIEAGSLIAKQDDEDIKLATGQSSALENVQKAKIAYEMAQDTFDKNATLYDAGAISESAYSQSKAQRDTALLQYQAASNMVSEQVSKTEIKSPGAGIISEINIKAGDYAVSGTKLATVSDTSKLILKGNLQETSVDKIKQGQTIRVYIDALDKEVDGVVSYVAAVAAAGGKLFPVEITIDNSEDTLKAGMSARASI